MPKWPHSIHFSMDESLMVLHWSVYTGGVRESRHGPNGFSVYALHETSLEQNFAIGAKKGSSVKPSIRILSRRSFAEFRAWKGAANGTGSSQIKVPLIMVDSKGQDFLLSRVVDEVH
ncbi:hypothetical protein CONPUDRAFT_157788 [Coniophora puteana RWD-64-598 SS2]|uniref:Uncharacterized protein n=1 Tax=Coniophora puteana (strain RWD-64-598) TaxID=741705 RepID=A0A5M3MCH4_CONPW|nr:uncharacterized protein CONPUDRAFT_157788 [Coniophora puteana RWD-64-598 SS2]EIW76604.1 hypothetical protein CONPUDRAFT_157788 [Coniophora puteana RWD-64-598 SS2]